MADQTVGRGVIELVADARKLRAGIEDAKRSIRTLGEGQRDISASASRSIDNYIGKLQQQNATFGRTVRETELFRLALRGASNEQIRAADAALRVAEANKQNAEQIASLRNAFTALGAIIGTSLIAGAVAIDRLVDKAANFQDLAEKMGDTAEAVASLGVAAAAGGTNMDTVAAASARLSKALTGVDDESEAAGAALKALGLNIREIQSLSPTQQIEAIAKAMNEFEDGTQKAAVAQALFGRSGAELLPFFKALAGEVGRQVILSQQQIEAADAYADAQAILKEQISQQAQTIAVELLPVINEFLRALSEVVTQEGFVTTATDVLRGALSGVVIVFQTISVVVSDVAFVFQTVGREIGAFAAKLDALARLDIRGFAVISEAVAEDTARARAELDKFQKAVMSIGQPNEFSSVRGGSSSTAGQQRRQLQFSGAVKKPPKGPTDNSAEREARAQLQFELDQIKRAGDASIAEFARSERILEARRAASLIEDREYYAAKRAFIELNARVQTQALEQEIALLQSQTFTGKNAVAEQIENNRKIADAQDRLARARADSVASIEINSIQEAAANERVRQTYLDAAAAADAYVDSIRRRNEAEIAGIGRGEKFRREQDGGLEIEERFLDQRRKLEGELRRGQITKDVFDTYLALAADAYQQEIALYQRRTAALDEAQSNWLNGAREALANYADESRNVAAQTEEIFTNAFKGLEDGLTDFLTKGKFDVKKFAASIHEDITRALVRQNITGPLADSLKDGNLLGNLGGIFGLQKPGTQPPAPVESRSIADAISGGAGAAASAVDAAGFSATIAASGTTFAATVTAASATFTPAVTAAGASFSATVAAAGAQFAASVSAASAGSAGSSGAGSLLSAFGDDFVGSFDTGTPYVPRTGLALVHEGERIVPAAQNAAGGGGMPYNPTFVIPPTVDKRSIAAVEAAAFRGYSRAAARGTAGTTR